MSDQTSRPASDLAAELASRKAANDQPTHGTQEEIDAAIAEAQIDGDANNAPPVRKAAIIANQRLGGEHPEGSASPIDRLTQDDQLTDY